MTCRRRAEKTADSLLADGHDVTGFTVDLDDAEAAARWVDESAERHLRATGNGSIINTASMSGLPASPRSGRPRTPRPRAA